MKNLITLILLLATSCSSEKSSNGGENSGTITIEEIIPTNLNLTIDIVGQNTDNLSGDGSGSYKSVQHQQQTP